MSTMTRIADSGREIVPDTRKLLASFHSEGGIVVYDTENERAWIESSDYRQADWR